MKTGSDIDWHWQPISEFKPKLGGAYCKIWVDSLEREMFATWTLVELPGSGAHAMAWVTEDNRVLALLDASRFVLLGVFAAPSKPVRCLDGAA